MSKIKFFLTRYLWWWLVDNIVGGFPVMVRAPDYKGYPRMSCFWVKKSEIIEIVKTNDDYKVNKKSK